MKWERTPKGETWSSEDGNSHVHLSVGEGAFIEAHYMSRPHRSCSWTNLVCTYKTPDSAKRAVKRWVEGRNG